ncbi:MAG TPA: hypothetical protein VMW10_04980 [Alphaproteobacteria bacterium]|nr:hypothetical protein [Alphaproteobacteria bacterium]
MKKFSYVAAGLICASVLNFNGHVFAQEKCSPVELVKKLYTSDLWKNPEENFHKVFHPDYKQYWHKENKYITYNYKQAYDHTVNDLKNKYANVTFYFSHIISDGNFVLARYVSKKSPKNNPQQCLMTPMMALWEIKDNKLYRCWETSVKSAEDANVFESFPIPSES